MRRHPDAAVTVPPIRRSGAVAVTVQPMALAPTPGALQPLDVLASPPSTISTVPPTVWQDVTVTVRDPSRGRLTIQSVTTGDPPVVVDPHAVRGRIRSAVVTLALTLASP